MEGTLPAGLQVSSTLKLAKNRQCTAFLLPGEKLNITFNTANVEKQKSYSCHFSRISVSLSNSTQPENYVMKFDLELFTRHCPLLQHASQRTKKVIN